MSTFPSRTWRLLISSKTLWLAQEGATGWISTVTPNRTFPPVPTLTALAWVLSRLVVGAAVRMVQNQLGVFARSAPAVVHHFLDLIH